MPKTADLHSRYNPAAEANRYLDSLNIKGTVDYFILIEPGMGYLSASLRERNPGAKIISLHAASPGEIPEKNKADAAWFPENNESLRDFLEHEIPDTEAHNIKIIEWRPGLAAYGQAYKYLLFETAEFIKIIDASIRTQNTFGKKWFRNFFRNLSVLSKIICPQKTDFPFLITGAGPGLEDVIPFIKNETDNLYIIAASSSVSVLNNAGIIPDMVISIDGGNWTLLHLFESFRCAGNLNFAVNMTAALPSRCNETPLLLICDSLWQNIILKELKIPFIALPQRGTVAAAALDLAFALTEDKVFISGVDLSQKDLQSHARPYAFDRLWDEKASRLNPAYSQVFTRSGEMKTGGSYNIYASWFNHQLEKYPKRLFSLGSNHDIFKNYEIRSAELNENIHLKKQKPAFDFYSVKFEKNPVDHAAKILTDALIHSRFSIQLASELNTLLFPEINLTINELCDAVFSLTKRK